MYCTPTITSVNIAGENTEFELMTSHVQNRIKTALFGTYMYTYIHTYIHSIDP